MNRQLKLILADGLILFAISSVIAICAHLSITALKKKGAKDDPIVTALLQGDLEETTKLAKRGEDSTNQVDDQGRTALMRAAYVNLSSAEAVATKDEDRAKVATILLDHGARVDSKDHDGWTALMWAAWSGLPKTAELLIDRGAAVGAADRRGNTALMLAARRGNAEIVKLLLVHHADISPANQDGRTARDMAQLGQREGTAEKAIYQTILGALGGN